MFAWVDLPMEAPRQGLAVPTSAVQRHDTETFVFVEESANQFRRSTVVTGIETSEYVEVVDGLVADHSIVEQGAFYLKSELLLEQDTD